MVRVVVNRRSVGVSACLSVLTAAVSFFGRIAHGPSGNADDDEGLGAFQ